MSCDDRFEHFKPEWCPGCGNFEILESLKQALCDLEMTAKDFIMVSGIGQTAKLGFSIKCNMFDGLHGRTLPLALGVKLANHETKVIAVSGDGGMYAEGGNHFIHNARRNLDAAVIAGHNRVYGLTKGQAAPTSGADFTSKVHPEGTGSAPVNPMLLALTSGATYVARGFSGNGAQLTGLLKGALQHRGFALVDVLFPCISFNKVNTFAWFKERVQPIPDDHDPADFDAAMKLAAKGDDELPTGLFYKGERAVFADQLSALKAGPIAVRTAEYTPERVRPLLEFYK